MSCFSALELVLFELPFAYSTHGFWIRASALIVSCGALPIISVIAYGELSVRGPTQPTF